MIELCGINLDLCIQSSWTSIYVCLLYLWCEVLIHPQFLEL